MASPKAMAAEMASVPTGPNGEVLSPAYQFLHDLLTKQVATENGIVEVYREEISSITNRDDYFVPTHARWELILLMRAQGFVLSQIAEVTKIDYPELLRWFHTPGVVRDLWNLLQEEEWERYKTMMRTRGLQAMEDKNVGPTEAIDVAAKVFILLRHAQGIQVSEDDPAKILQAMTRNLMPLPKG